MERLRHHARSLARRAAVLVLCAGGFAGCGSSDHARLRASDAAQLHSVLAAARASAVGGDSAGALDQLRTFDSEVRGLAAKGRLTSADVHALRVGARQARAAIAREASPTSTPTPTPTATPTVAAPTPRAPTKVHKPPKKQAGPKKHPKDKHGKGHD